ncbi:LysR family transcriptional regulator [Burkholderia alba]|uniref:LysR family transcriptional regulator n=1 Tax=Burkholderia alba TaxID=2683677 RepID=UPI002B0570D1|nr:LysR family transcriptional regulator [Burkholderia alba]
MKLSQLGFFCAVVEQRTIAAAAEQLHCVPSNITTRLRELEALLGVTLFSRERNRLLVTPEGRLLYDRAKALLGAADDTRQLFAGERRAGALRLGALDVALGSHLPKRIAEYRRAMPGVELHVHPGHSFALERRLIDGELDLIVSDGPIEHPLLASSLAFRETLKLVTPRALRTPSPARLAEFEMYVFGTDCYYRQQVDEWLARTGAAPRALLEVESYPVMFACVAAGHGIACAPESFIRASVDAAGLRAHALDAIGESHLYFIWRKQQRSTLIAEFIDIVAAPPRG